jgi:hypothetical protein
MRDRVALIARDAATRSRIERCLADAGFAIEPFIDSPPIAGGSSAAVWVVEQDDDAEAIATRIRPWLIARAKRRAVVHTYRPSSIREMLDHDLDRLSVLVPPVFPWQIVDALRAPGGRW